MTEIIKSPGQDDPGPATYIESMNQPGEPALEDMPFPLIPEVGEPI